MKATDEQIRAAYEAHGGNFSTAGASLGMTRTGFRLRALALGLEANHVGRQADSKIGPDGRCPCGSWAPPFATHCRCGAENPRGLASQRALSALGRLRDGTAPREPVDIMIDNMALYWSRRRAA